jgi:dihydroneopterin aldolase
MTGMMSIELKALHFYAFHGLYKEEKKTGNSFIVDLSVSFLPSSGTITDLSDTINYAKLYALVKEEMQKPRHLLETLAMELAEIIHAVYPAVKKIHIAIDKKQAPIVGMIGTAGVNYDCTF